MQASVQPPRRTAEGEIGDNQTGAYLTEGKCGDRPPDVLSIALNRQTHPISASSALNHLRPTNPWIL